jgi:hypothetical protein
MMARWHLGRWLILGALLVAAFGVTPAHAACVAPRLFLDTPTTKMHAGDSVTVGGAYWTNECNDTVVCGGCGGDCAGDEPERPLHNITILLAPARGQNGAQLVLAEGVDAKPDLTFNVDVVIPPQASPGGYRVAAHAVGGDLFFGPRIRIVE